MGKPKLLSCLLGISILINDANAAPLSAGNIAVAWDQFGVGSASQIREYTQAGSLVQSFNLPAPEDVRDLTVTPDGKVHLFHGTFSPEVTTLDPTTGQISQRTFTGWSTVNAIHYGGITAVGNYIFVTDMETANDGSTNGIVRFNLNDNTVERFWNRSGEINEYHSAFIDISLGADGLLYAVRGGLSPSPNTIEVFDPQTMASLRVVTLDWSHNLRAVAVDGSGDIYAVGDHRSVVHFNPSGTELNRLVVLSNGAPSDIDITLDGTLFVTEPTNTIAITDTSLTSVTTFSLPTATSIFSSAVPQIPEPSTYAILTVLAALLRRRRVA